MSDNRIYLSTPNVGSEEQQVLSEILEGGWVAPVGSHLDHFEKDLELRFPGKRVLSLNSGTSSIHLALILAGVKSGDEVIIGTFTFAACANAVLYLHARPVFIDSESISWNLDPDLLADYLKSTSSKPKALIVTHLYGVPARIDEIRELCLEYGITMVEDAAEAMGSLYMDKQVGSLGEFGILSFNGNKIITTGGGGALICNGEMYDKGLHLATQANSGEFGYNHDEIGYNYRMSNVLAGIGNEQLKKLEKFVEKKRWIFSQYMENLSPDIFGFPHEPSNAHCNRWLTTPLINESQTNVPIELIRFLDEKDIESRALWKPLHLHKAYEQFDFIGTGIAEGIYYQGLCLPSGTDLTPTDLERVVSSIQSFYQ